MFEKKGNNLDFDASKGCLDLTFDTIIIGQKGQKPL